MVVAMGLFQQKSGFAAASFLRSGPEENKEQNYEGLSVEEPSSFRSPRPSGLRTLVLFMGIHSRDFILDLLLQSRFISSHPVENLPLPSWQS